MPISVGWQTTEPLIEWCYAAGSRFSEPFFEQTVTRLLRQPFNRLFRQRTSIGALAEFHAREPGLPPRGFIFHTSRCGSTLVAQMLAASPRNVVISEAPPLDSIIRADVYRAQTRESEKIAWLHWMTSALGQKRDLQSARVFIKFDAWHTLDLELLLRAFPAVPWIFLYRHPLEVLVSQKKMRGLATAPGLIKHRAVQSQGLLPDEYAAYMLSLICEAALKYRHHPNVLFVNYSQLPQLVTTTLLQHFQLDCAAAELERMNSATQFDAKNPQINFAPDSAAKQQTADENLRDLAEKLLSLYDELEAARYAGAHK